MAEYNGNGVNVKDPLYKQNDVERVKHLMAVWGQAAHQFTYDDVINAGLNIVLTAIRQRNDTRQKAEVEWDTVTGKAKQLLMDHYTSSGRVKGVFPYDQVIFPGVLKAKIRFPS